MSESSKDATQQLSRHQGHSQKIIRCARKVLVSAPSLLKRTCFLVLGILALAGILDSFILSLGWGRVYEGTEEILNASMKSAATNTMLLALIKGVVGFISSIEGQLLVVSASLGEAFSGFSELIDLAFNFFLTMSGLVAAKISFIKIIELTGISVFVGPALILMAMDPSLKGVLGKLGKMLLSIGLVLFFLFPATIATVGNAYENHRVQTEIEYTENLGILSEQVDEISFRSISSEEGRSKAMEVVNGGTKILWNGFMSLVVSYILMFIFLPVISLGLCYLIIKQILADGGYSKASENMGIGAKLTGDFMLSRNKKKEQQQEVVE